MFAEERQQKIYDLICEQRSVKVQQLSDILDTSEVTIRRDLLELHKQKKIIRTHGGAIAYCPVGVGVSVQGLIASALQIEEKKLIAQRAYEFIQDFDTILLDGSTTVYELVKLLAVGEKQNLIIISMAPLTVMAFGEIKNCKIIMAGGNVSYLHNTVEGPIANKFIQGIRVDKSFIGVNGIDESFRVSTPRFEDAELKTLAMACATQSFILADHTKFGKEYLANVEGQCDYIITDRFAAGFPYKGIDPRCTIIFADEQDRQKE